jgi:hypothetical protein
MVNEVEHDYNESPAEPTHGTWVRAQMWHKIYLGHVYQLDFEDPYLLKDVMPFDGGPPKDHRKQACSVREVMLAKVITLFPAYEFTVRENKIPVLGPDGKPRIDPETHLPHIGISREPSITGIDFNLHPVPVHIRGDVALYVFSQAHKADQATLRDFCRHAESTLHRHREEAMAQSTGVVANATPEQMHAEAERQRRVRRG